MKQETQEEPIRGCIQSEPKLLGVEYTLKDGSTEFVSFQEPLEEAFYEGWILRGSGASFRDALEKWFEQFKKK